MGFISRRLAVVGFCAMGLVACGGGGGGGPSNPEPTATITAGNAAQIAAGVSQTTDNMIGAGAAGSGAVPLSAGFTRTAVADFDLARFSKERLLSVRGMSATPSSPASVQAAAQTIVTNCDTGTVTVVVNDAGNAFSETFSNCTLAGITLNGTVNVSNVTVVGNPGVDPSWSISATFSYSLTVTDGVSTETFSGAFGFGLAVNGTAETVTMSITSFTVTDGGSTASLGNVTISRTEDSATGGYSFTANGSITDSVFGTVSVQTTTPFTGVGTGVPSAGSMTITGANGSRVVVTATGGGNVRLDVFTDSSDTVPDVINTTWASLATL